ncbi:hypothetical protein EJ110_NYTH14503 [Nymphaea thermarum]|nr:hypothetical protein EJ110_NYTH14503 [Nymphaea thermarum]
MDFVNNSESQENGVISCNGTAWSGEAFGSSGSWHITVHNAQQRCTKVHIVGFKGKVVHAMELYSMDHNQVDDLISGKMIVVVLLAFRSLPSTLRLNVPASMVGRAN